MITALYTTDTTAESAGVFTNERQLGRALLPERFESTSVPACPTVTVVELGVSDLYDLPAETDTPVVAVAHDL